MSDYTKATNFTAKDALASGNANKVVSGTEIDTEFDNIATAIATKYDAAADLPAATTTSVGVFELATTAEAQALTSNALYITPSGLNDVLTANGGMLGDIQALADPNADTILGWDDSAGAVINYTIGDGLVTDTTTIDVAGTNPIVVTASAVTLDITTLTNNAGSALVGADEFLIYDSTNTEHRVIAYQAAGFPIVTGSAAKTFVSADVNKVHELSGTIDRAFTLNTGVGQAGNVIILHQSGTGSIQINGTSTVNSVNGLFTRTQYSVAILLCLSTDVWTLFGDTATT